MGVHLAMQAFQRGFLEKLAALDWTSEASAKRHAKKHARRMQLTPETYLTAASDMLSRIGDLKKVPDRKHRGSNVYWDSSTGRKLITTPKGQIVSFYYAGSRP